jgi:predicted transcriptional regulator/transcriptional regulator with XRE-family HTH domain
MTDDSRNLRRPKLLVGARVRNLREDRGISQAELARLLDISPSYLNQIERNHRPLTVAVLLRLSEEFGIDSDFFAPHDDARLLAELRDALLDDVVDVKVSRSELADLVADQPTIARALVALRRRHHDLLERTSALLGEPSTSARMPHEEVRDFFYDRSNHIAPLDTMAEELAGALRLEPGDVRVPLARRLADVHGIRVLPQPATGPTGELRLYDPQGRILRLSNQLRPGQQAFQLAMQLALLEHDELLTGLAAEASFSGPEARALARIGLAQYYAGALLMPYTAFRAAAEELQYDIERLSERFRVGFETVCHRLSTLQRPRQRGVSFSFIRVDRAGNISKRQSASGLHFGRGGGTCPLWAVYEAFAAPGRIHTQIAEMPDGRRYFWIARTVARRRTGYGVPGKMFAVGLGCDLRHARRLVYSRGLDLGQGTAAMPIGPGCATCERTACPQRAAPMFDRPLDVDEHRTTFVPYAVERDGSADRG